MLEDFLFSTVSTSVPEETKTNYATLMLLNPDYIFFVFFCEHQEKAMHAYMYSFYTLPPFFPH